MKDSKVYDCTIIELDRHHTPQGNLSVVTNSREVPFDVKRVYYSYDIPGGKARGAHAHRRLYQLLVAASSAFSVTLDDGLVRRTFLLNHPYQGLLIVPGIWRTLDEFSSGAVCLCLASEAYDPHDYIRDYQQFLDYKHGE